MVKIFEMVCFYGGLIMVVVSSILALIKGLNDDEVDKNDMFWGMYLFHYPLYTVLFFVGLALMLLGKIAM